MSNTDSTRIGLIKGWLGRLTALALLALIFLGPPLYVLSKVLAGSPLWATRTVTVTQTEHYGVLPGSLPILLLWMSLMVIAYGMAVGYVRPIR